MELVAKIIEKTLECFNNPLDIIEMVIRPGRGQYWTVDVNADKNIFVVVSWLGDDEFKSDVIEVIL